jgi:PmbA protein
MIKEYITFKSKETTIKVAGNEINAIRTKNTTKKGVRVYENGKIGISGCIGNQDDETLVLQAIDNLKTNIKYPYEVSKNHKEYRDYKVKKYTPAELKTLTEDILEILKKDYSDFLFSHMISYNEDVVTLKNNEGLDLKHTDASIGIGLILKEKSSANLFDGFIGYGGREFDYDRFINFNRMYLDAYKIKADLPNEEKMPVIFIEEKAMFRSFFAKNFNGEKYGTGGSLYSGKMGEQIFGEKVNMYYSQDPKKTGDLFFDTEGTVLKDDRINLVENGKLVHVISDKKTAEDYKLPHTGGAKGEYDSRPGLTYFDICFELENDDIKTALKGQKAIFVVISSGGDFTPDGTYGAPVQVSLLYDGEKFLGKLDEFSISSHIDRMLGEDYIGTFKSEDIYMGDEQEIFACYMDINRG